MVRNPLEKFTGLSQSLWPIMSLALVCFVFMFTQACSSAEHRRYHDESTARSILRYMVYFKDDRTGLCFAAMETDGGRDRSFACVPCEAVQDLLVKPSDPVREPEPEPRHSNNNFMHR